MNEDGFETSDAEIVYLKECFDGKRNFSRIDRDEYINKNAQAHYEYLANKKFIKKEITIDGNRFENIEGFYNEIDRVFTRNMKWKTGHNLDAFNDILRGGFGVHKYGEPFIMIWENTDKSRKDFSWNATVKHYEEMLIKCHPTNRKIVRELLKNAKLKKGVTLFDNIIGIIKEHEQIELMLK